MPVTVECRQDHVRISGDVELEMRLPAPADMERDIEYRVRLSDGMEVTASLDSHGDTWFAVRRHGPGKIVIGDPGETSSFDYSGDVEAAEIEPLYEVARFDADPSLADMPADELAARYFQDLDIDPDAEAATTKALIGEVERRGLSITDLSDAWDKLSAEEARLAEVY